MSYPILYLAVGFCALILCFFVMDERSNAVVERFEELGEGDVDIVEDGPFIPKEVRGQYKRVSCAALGRSGALNKYPSVNNMLASNRMMALNPSKQYTNKYADKMDKNGGKDFCFMDNDDFGHADPLFKSGAASCSKGDPIFGNPIFSHVSNAKVMNKSDVLHSKKCVFKINPDKLNDRNLGKLEDDLASKDPFIMDMKRRLTPKATVCPACPSTQPQPQPPTPTVDPPPLIPLVAPPSKIITDLEQIKKLAPGSWWMSCRNAVYDEGTTELGASCASTTGEYKETKIQVNNCAGREIQNISGSLICEPPVTDPLEILKRVPGSWTESCSNTSLYSNDILFADCTRIDGSTNQNMFNYASCPMGAPVGNNDGNLVC